MKTISLTLNKKVNCLWQLFTGLEQNLGLGSTQTCRTEFFCTFPAEEFNRFRKKPVLLLLTGVNIALLNVCRAAAGLAKLGSVWRGLLSFFEIGMRSFSEIKKGKP